MAASTKTDVTWQHEAIRKQTCSLIKSLSGLASRTSQGIGQSVRLKDQIMVCRWPLYDFRETMRYHIHEDETLLEKRHDSTVEDINREHEVIQKQLDQVISLAEDAVYHKLSESELDKIASDIWETVYRMTDLITTHTAKEDKLLEQS